MQELVHRYLALGRWALGREVLESFGELMHDRVEPVYTEDVLGERSASSRRTLTVTVQTCGDLRDIRPLVEGQPSTAFPLQTAFVPSNVNSYALPPTIRSRVIRLSLRGAQRRGNLVEVEHVPGNHHCYGDEIATLRSQ